MSDLKHKIGDSRASVDNSVIVRLNRLDRAYCYELAVIPDAKASNLGEISVGFGLHRISRCELDSSEFIRSERFGATFNDFVWRSTCKCRDYFADCAQVNAKMAVD